MAKLTARFDMQDKISKKLRAIRGEIDSLQRARDRVNKPITMMMRVRDNASKILKRLHMFVLEDIAKTHTVTVQVKDKATKALTAVSNFMKRRMPRTHALFVDAKDKATPVLQRITRFAQKNIARAQIMTIIATDRAMPVVSRIGSFARSTLSSGYNFTVRGIDMASRVIGSVASYTASAIPRVRSFAIQAINKASNVIGSVRRALFSIPTVITVTLAAVGLHSLGDATVGAAMNFEQYEVSMTHWLDGNTKKAKELVGWMGQFADSTPFSSPDLFPALATGVGIAGGNIPEAQRMLKIASDMAALTPGRSVVDAMDALGAAQMGEFEMMKGFGMRILKEDYKAMGGWKGFLTNVEGNFKDGAKKLSETSIGIIATLKGYRGSLLRTLGDGILLPMKPRLDAINKWLANNQETWGRWKSVVKTMGGDASEWLFSRLETGFSHIKNNYLENDEFNKLDFEGKIKFISEDIGAWWSSKGKPALSAWWESSGKPWAEKIGLFVGRSIFDGIVLGITEGGKALGGMWKDAFKDPSLGAFGGAGVATLLAGMLSSLVLSPLITAVSVLGKGVKNAGKVGKKVAGWFSKDKGPKTTVAPTGGGSKPTRTPKAKQEYRMPWTNQGAKPVLNVPNTKDKGFKMPKGLSRIGDFAKRIPVLGTALGALAIATSSKEDRAGTIGAVGGGLAGAATGAALGSVVPVVGTAIGGIIGGIFGSLGGQALGDWLSDNWSSIKAGAAATGKWISKAFNASVEWIGDIWGSFAGWFSNSVWNPVSDGARSAVRWIQDKWAATTGWFSARIWKPLTKGFDTTLNFVVGLYDIAEGLIKVSWGAVSFWFNRTVWIPLKKIAETTWSWISTKASYAWTGIKVLWGLAASWFSEKVWTPITTAASIAWDWITKTIDNAWLGVQVMWGVAVSWFQNTIWTPLMSAAGVVGAWIGNKFTEGWNAVTSIWSVATGWFEDTIWSPIKEGVGVLGAWIGEKFTEGWNSVVTIWRVASGYFEENIWTPIKTGAAAVKDAIITPFEEAWAVVSGIFTKLGDTWDTIKQWGGKAVEWTDQATDYVVERGKQRRAGIPEYARGTNFHKGGPAIVGDGGGPELIRYPSGKMTLSPGADTFMNLPRGTEVLSHRKTMNFFNQIPAYADGIGFSGGVPEQEVLPQEQVVAATSSTGRGKKSVISGIRDVIVQITGESHYHNEMDAEKVGKVAVAAVKKELEDGYFEGGEMLVDV